MPSISAVSSYTGCNIVTHTSDDMIVASVNPRGETTHPRELGTNHLMVVGFSVLVLISFVAACTINMEARVTTQDTSVSCDHGLFYYQANELSVNFTPSCWPDHAFLRGDVSTI